MTDKFDSNPLRSSGTPHVSKVLGRITGRTMNRRGFSDSRMLENWSAIVGPEIAALSQPDRIRRGGPDGAVLTVRVEGAMAIEVQHMAPQIIERINAHFGAGTLARLHIVQGPLPMAGRGRAQAALGKDEIDAARAALGDVKPGRLQSALARLGAQIARQRKS